MLLNPVTYNSGIALLSNILRYESDDFREQIVDKVTKKFKNIPNCDYLNICLQRLTIKTNRDKIYDCKLCETLYNNEVNIWSSDWINGKKKYNIENILRDFIDEECIESLDNVIGKDEILIFNKYD